ncbi:hypothetical protein VQ03_20190 [Methylobacterium tarhaniae]|uniref:Uncharacterized protein n=1 Tax=Methylobacterium tarhaniae TaxID=1187852 RepID=A0A0J6SSK8_9HYPH|nr:ParA family protein [Methylobacterium tarhaniae]KMO36684.1 hypothetical protein VQ03_20190 [Methylobacterium tarhaniae]
MHVLTVAAHKGGAGKSTVSILLASLFAHARLRVVLIDTDEGQNTAFAWASRRALAQPAVVTIDSTARLTDLVGAARRHGIDFCLIDTPAGYSAMGRAAVEAADLVIIPTKCDAADRWALRTTVEAVREAEKPFLIVPTDVPPRRLGREAPELRLLRADLPDLASALWNGQLTGRRSIGQSIAEGRAPSEVDWRGVTSAECRDLWRRVMDAVPTGRAGAYAS